MTNGKLLLPRLKFSTEGVKPGEQFDAWRAFSSMADLEAITPPVDGFKASSTSYHMGSMLLSSYQLSPMNLRYTHANQRKIGMDHWCLSVVTQGPIGYEANANEFNIASGELILHSYASPFSAVMDNTNYSGVFFARDDFWDIADHLDKASHQLVKGPMSQIVRDFMVSLAGSADGLTRADASAVSEAFGHLVRAMIVSTPTSFEAAKAPITAIQFDRARRYINANLASPSLNPGSISLGIGVSRRQLYYLFERQGGVATYIRNRRLDACYTALSKVSETRHVGAIAYHYGFTNLSSFYRQFSARYGFSPREARAAADSGQVEVAAESTFVDWLLSAGQK